MKKLVLMGVFIENGHMYGDMLDVLPGVTNYGEYVKFF